MIQDAKDTNWESSLFSKVAANVLLPVFLGPLTRNIPATELELEDGGGSRLDKAAFQDGSSVKGCSERVCCVTYEHMKEKMK